MPARHSSMELSSPEGDPAVPSNATRSKSGRVVRKPQLYSESSPVVNSKRKRAQRDEDDADAAEDASESEEDSESEPDEEELRDRRTQTRKRKSNTVRAKPAAKKPKTNGETVSLPLRSASGKPKRGKKAQPRASGISEGEGLYAEIFGGENTLDEVAALWLRRFGEHESRSMAEIVNFVLRCAGCDQKVDEHDIEDPDNCSSRLGDIQDEYQSQNIVEYPLISRAKGTAAFRQAIVDFFHFLIRTIASSGHLYDTPELLENIEIWVGTLSSAANRPFRHTATVVALTIISALAETGKELVEIEAQTLRQREGEKKKRTKNQRRISDMEDKAKKADQRKQLVVDGMKSWFDAVFVHRYRDVDPRIRVDCAQALGDWIATYPDYFFEGTHLRYLGWVLSDSHGPTRLEVVRQLQRLYRDKTKLGGLKTFTERFRPRMVEMATSDAEVTVRIATIELLDILRDAGFLEPDDIDTVGRLIFDAEPRVRKAIVGFFAENINDMYEMKFEEIGGQEALDESGYAVDDDVYNVPRVEWLKFKALAEVLNGYDAQDEGDAETDAADLVRQGYLVVGSGIETRLSLAAQDLFSHIPEIKMWEVLSGYLLFDHSSKPRAGTVDEIEIKIRGESALDDSEEKVLLDVLNASVKMSFAEAVEAEKDKKRTKAQRQEAQETLDRATRHLADVIPKLLKKFGRNSDTVSAVLRLEPLLNLDIFEAARQESLKFSAHLDDINKQLLTHSSESVAVEASAALLHAREHEELGDITEPKFQALWEESISALHTLRKGNELSVRGNLNTRALTTLANVVLRIENFAKISNCVDYLDKVPTAPKRAKSQTHDVTDGFAIILDIVQRGIPTPESDPDTDTLEDSLVVHACYTLTFYFAWHIRAWTQLLETGKTMPAVELEKLREKRDALIRTLYRVIRSRHGADTTRTVAASTMLDILTIIATLRTAKRKLAAGQPRNEDHLDFVIAVPPKAQEQLQSVLIAAEKALAKKMGRKLEVADDDDPIDPDDEPVSEEEEEEEAEDEQSAREAKMIAQLVAERHLCDFASKIVFAIAAAILDEGADGTQPGPMRKLLQRNRQKLGKNYAEIVASLDEKKAKKSAAAAKGKGKAASATPVPEHGGRKGNEAGEDSDEEEESGLRVDHEAEAEAEAEELREQAEIDGDEEVEEMEDVESVIGD